MYMDNLQPGDKFILVDDLIDNDPEHFPHQVDVYTKTTLPSGMGGVRDKDGTAFTLRSDLAVIQLIGNQIPSLLQFSQATTQRTSCNEQVLDNIPSAFDRL